MMMPLAGRAIDYLGTRLGYLIAVIVWSIAAAAHALAGSALGFGAARFALGFGEAANFPAALKTVAVWFPQRERALATGIFNSGANIGALAGSSSRSVPGAALRMAIGVHRHGSDGGSVDHRLALAVSRARRTPSSLGPGTRSDPFGRRRAIRQRIPYRRLLTDRAAWAFLVGKFLTDPVWWFYLFWLPGFLNRTYGVDLSNLGLPLVVIYQASMVGSIGGGWMSSAMIKHGWTVNRARKTAMLICAVAVTSAIFIGQTGGNLWLAVTLISIAAAAHQGWSANIFNLPSDVFPQSAVASVVGLGGMGGAVGGLLVSPAIGYWLDWSNGSYGPLFVVAGYVST